MQTVAYLQISYYGRQNKPIFSNVNGCWLSFMLGCKNIFNKYLCTSKDLGADFCV